MSATTAGRSLGGWAFDGDRSWAAERQWTAIGQLPRTAPRSWRWLLRRRAARGTGRPAAPVPVWETRPVATAAQDAIVARRVTVEGRVQGVGYRQACADAARRFQVAGWVRNRRAGGVEAHFEGPPGAVAQSIAWCRSGPRLATVTGVRVAEAVPTGTTGFRIGTTE